MIKKISAIIYFIFIITINSFASITNPYNTVNNNEPYFTKEEKQYLIPFENYSELDELGRCGPAKALICEEIMPKKDEKRKDISKIIPTGWTYNKKSNNNKYDFIPGKYIYNRCHLIAYSLSGENDNKLNIITGTRSLNIQGMYEFEQDILSYCKKTKNHVLYRVTPEFENDEVIARSVLMEGYSIEDQGEGICFCIRAWNNEDGIKINYKTGQNRLKTEDINSDSNNQQETINYNGYVDDIEPYFRKIGETNPPIPKFSDEAFTQEGLENAKEPVITTTTEDITDTIKIREETSKEKEITAIDEQIESAITTIKIIFPIIISTMILIFVVLFTDKILKRKRRK